ncbi:ABC transporter ATP-binding protein [Anoxynatronum buryatiense]|uniref:ATP-binding cassette, subfamily B n=1 Tax=Anoxynatronum buryatiense TaxID=489973 RepID=A0AA45WSX2_9CLOT|nr:ABC transporter ATP-binding protein [Anoxynatronum buryatiense]SMP39762.1 ATP-binding cassette, subfamily B [Anoxynatronum buryatiense]
MSTYRALIPFALKNKWVYLLGVFSLLAVDALQLIIPEILRRLTDGLQTGSLGHQQLLSYSLLIVLIGLFIMVFRFFWRILIINASRRLEYELRNQLFDHLLSLSPSYYSRKKTGDLMAHATNDIMAVRMAASAGVITLTDALFLNIAAITMMMLTTDVRLTLIALIPMPILAFSIYLFGDAINHRFKKVQRSFSMLTEKVQENISGIRVIKSFAREDIEMQRFHEANQDVFQNNMKLALLFGTFHPAIQFISGISFVVTLLYGTRLVLYQTITLGDFVAFNAYLISLVWSVPVIGFVINILQRGAASLSRINEVLAVEPDIKQASTPISLRAMSGAFSFHQVSFRYPGSETEALKDFSVSVSPGESLGIMGKTGSGKSTVPTLLLRLYDVDDGHVSIDGHPIKALSLNDLRNQVGYVEQNSFIFSATIADNIAFGTDTISLETIEQAAEKAGLHSDICRFPKQYHTIVGERGVTLSGGQKQRLAIARALVKNPALLIFDDALSAVDTQTEKQILDSLKETITNTTTLIIAHRVSTLQQCQRILVLEEGQIIESGTHEQLLQLNGYYARQHRRQQLEEELSSGERSATHEYLS